MEGLDDNNRFFAETFVGTEIGRSLLRGYAIAMHEEEQQALRPSQRSNSPISLAIDPVYFELDDEHVAINDRIHLGAHMYSAQASGTTLPPSQSTHFDDFDGGCDDDGYFTVLNERTQLDERLRTEQKKERKKEADFTVRIERTIAAMSESEQTRLQDAIVHGFRKYAAFEGDSDSCCRLCVQRFCQPGSCGSSTYHEAAIYRRLSQ
jgi:hypothetical protein